MVQACSLVPTQARHGQEHRRQVQFVRKSAGGREDRGSEPRLCSVYISWPETLHIVGCGHMHTLRIQARLPKTRGGTDMLVAVIFGGFRCAVGGLEGALL